MWRFVENSPIHTGHSRWWWLSNRVAAADQTFIPAGPANVRRSAKLARLEAVLLVADAALSPRRLAQVAMLADATEARTLINRLNTAYESVGTPFRVERVAAGYRLLTLPQFAFWLGKLHHREADLKLSPPAFETLTVIAYRQPITRADVEAIRGVQCSEMIKQLMERGLVRIGGEDDSLGRPFLYETTRRFLETFGLRDLEDLPLAEKLRRPGAAHSGLSAAVNAALPEANVPSQPLEQAG
ncbi:MAG TPA: SMC-Scp complex subunit ScpB [Planctomycetaceae bacterium]|jgi:segregation and condensation protein B|nr:SMC-Scp complex subunit ScpB [Planctomycetaceae bacterium]